MCPKTACSVNCAAPHSPALCCRYRPRTTRRRLPYCAHLRLAASGRRLHRCELRLHLRRRCTLEGTHDGNDVWCCRAGRQVLNSAGHTRRHNAPSVDRTSGRRRARQEIRHGTEHQDGPHEADVGTPTTADGYAAHSGAAPAGACPHVQVFL